MIKIVISLLMFVSVPLMAQTSDTDSKAHITGTVSGTNGYLIMLQYLKDSLKRDTIDIHPDGSFDAAITVEEPTTAFLLASDSPANVKMFLESDMEVQLNIIIKSSSYNGLPIAQTEVDYKGDNKDCFEYMKTHDGMELYANWPYERLDTMRFSDYHRLFLMEVEKARAEVMDIKSLPFRRMTLKQIEDKINRALFRYAWSNADKQASDFVNWIESLDRNDPENKEIITNYLRWYQSIENTEKEDHCSYFKQVKNVFTNQDIINGLSDEYIQRTLKHAPSDMEEALVFYLQTSTNKDGHKEAQRLYDHYKSMKVGSPAVDFHFYDKLGKKYTLKDLRGKAVFIDCWATWCGPCLTEIPYMIKLYEHYKNNKKLEFISISFDDNQDKWEKKIAKDKLGWRQFILKYDNKSSLASDYDIATIPRFLMFDKQGNIISLDAPFPSSPNIIEWIDSHLK